MNLCLPNAEALIMIYGSSCGLCHNQRVRVQGCSWHGRCYECQVPKERAERNPATEKCQGRNITWGNRSGDPGSIPSPAWSLSRPQEKAGKFLTSSSILNPFLFWKPVFTGMGCGKAPCRRPLPKLKGHCGAWAAPRHLPSPSSWTPESSLGACPGAQRGGCWGGV